MFSTAELVVFACLALAAAVEWRVMQSRLHRFQAKVGRAVQSAGMRVVPLDSLREHLQLKRFDMIHIPISIPHAGQAIHGTYRGYDTVLFAVVDGEGGVMWAYHVRLPNVTLPRLHVRPKGMTAALRYNPEQPPNGEIHVPSVSSAYFVAGEDEGAVRAFMARGVGSWLLRNMCRFASEDHAFVLSPSQFYAEDLAKLQLALDDAVNLARLVESAAR